MWEITHVIKPKPLRAEMVQQSTMHSLGLHRASSIIISTYMNVNMEWLIGGKYQITKLIGTGSFSSFCTH